MTNYFWTIESWGADYAPENASDIIDAANEMIEKFAACHDEEETANYSTMLWDRYCTTGRVEGETIKCEPETAKKSRYKLRIIGEREPLYYSDLKIALDAQTRAQAAGKVALLMGWDDATQDYTVAL